MTCAEREREIRGKETKSRKLQKIKELKKQKVGCNNMHKNKEQDKLTRC